MARSLLHIIVIILLASLVRCDALGCTSAIVGANASACGHAMLWKHRDSSATHSFVARTEATDSTLAYIALHNAGDSLLSEAWVGVNAAGFAIMNTASYNLQEPGPEFADREGLVMAQALAVCLTVDDFAMLLEAIPSPRGVEANFGVIDAGGNAAYFEVDNSSVLRFDLADGQPYMLRTNYSISGDPNRGYGYTRLNNADKLLQAEQLPYSPSTFLDGLSCSFLNTCTGHNPMAEGDRWAVDQDFIPRRSTSAAVVIESGPEPTMWIVMGYPPMGRTLRATVSDIPSSLLPNAEWSSDEADDAWSRRANAFPHPADFDYGDKYVDLDAIRTYRLTMPSEKH